MIRMTVKITIWMNVATCVFEVTLIMIMMMIMTCYRSVVLFTPFDVMVDFHIGSAGDLPTPRVSIFSKNSENSV